LSLWKNTTAYRAYALVSVLFESSFIGTVQTQVFDFGEVKLMSLSATEDVQHVGACRLKVGCGIVRCRYEHLRIVTEIRRLQCVGDGHESATEQGFGYLQLLHTPFRLGNVSFQNNSLFGDRTEQLQAGQDFGFGLLCLDRRRHHRNVPALDGDHVRGGHH